MKVVLVTGSAGLVGSEAVRFYTTKADLVIGIDNDMRATFFGPEASTAWCASELSRNFENYVHKDLDIRDSDAMDCLFAEYGEDIALVIHAAAQPSHDWAARSPSTDFAVNANGTLVLLEVIRKHCPDTNFIFMSTNKVYGNRPNDLPLVECQTRWELAGDHVYYSHGVDESMSVDMCIHSLFGVSKLAADFLVQEYGRYFGLKCAIFRAGCITGPGHSGTQLHGFLSYLIKCAVTRTPYIVFGYKGKQVRDNIHSADLINAFEAFHRSPRRGEVYNIGGSRFSNCSMLEAIAICEEISGTKMDWSYSEDNRIGDHIWWISDIRKFQQHYPSWQITRDVPAILREIYNENVAKWQEHP